MYQQIECRWANSQFMQTIFRRMPDTKLVMRYAHLNAAVLAEKDSFLDGILSPVQADLARYGYSPWKILTLPLYSKYQ